VKDFLKNNYAVLGLYFISLFVSLLFIYNYDKNAIHLYMNNYVGDKYLNLFFYYINYIGDGMFAPLILLLVLVFNARLGICATASFAGASIVSSILKYGPFDDENRPFFIFSYIDKHTLNQVEGVDVHIHNSFPSGHSTQAFAILMCLAYATQKQALKFIYFFLALFTALSRVYLSQHWLIDITAGSMIGVFFSLLFYYLFITRNKMPKLNKPVFELKKA
jgi:membrane-associated phospholipid phosphatase